MTPASRRRLWGFALCVAVVAAVWFAAFYEPSTQSEARISTQPAPTTSTPVPTSTIVVNGMVLGIPPLPPGVTLEPEPAQGVTNVHQRIGSIEEILATVPPEQREAVAKAWDDMLRQMGAGQVPTTSTTRP